MEDDALNDLLARRFFFKSFYPLYCPQPGISAYFLIIDWLVVFSLATSYLNLSIFENDNLLAAVGINGNSGKIFMFPNVLSFQHCTPCIADLSHRLSCYFVRKIDSPSCNYHGAIKPFDC